MSDKTRPEPAQVETVAGRPDIDDLLIAAGVSIAAVISALLVGPGFGLLVITLALLAAAFWISYSSVSHSSKAQPGTSSSQAVAAPGSFSDSSSNRRTLSRPTLERSLDRATFTSLSFLSTLGSILAIFLAGAFLFLKDRDIVPPGFFTDEAEIGLQSWKLLHGDATTTTIPFFYRHLEYNHLGTLSLFATAPFVEVFGLTEHSVRGASAFWMIAAAVIIYLTLRRLRVPYAAAPVIIMIMSPLVILIARTNFGHAPSLLAMSLGFLAWIIGRQQSRTWIAFLGGVLIGLSAYGQPSYYIGVPVLLVAIGLTEIVYNRGDLSAYRSLVGMGLGAVLILLPIPYRALTYDPFLDRYRDKTEGAAHGLDRVWTALERYPEYFSYDMLFVHGTTGWQTRHSIPGAPWFYSSMLLFLLIGFASLLLIRGDSAKRYFLPMALVLLFYPIPDIVSRFSTDDPYSYSLVWGSIGIPFVVGYGLIGARRLTSRVSFPRPALLYSAAMVLATLVSLVGFWRGAFANYPNVAADYWGWQFGAQQISAYFRSHADEYDEFIMSGDFNAAYVFPQFYFAGDPLQNRVYIGDPGDIDLSKRQLLALRVDELRSVPGNQFPSQSYLQLVDTIYYPNGQPAFYLLTVDPALENPGTGNSQTPAG